MQVLTIILLLLDSAKVPSYLVMNDPLGEVQL